MENIQWEVIKQVLAAIIRYALASLGTFLVTKGWVDPALADAFVNQAAAIVLGVLIIVATVGWKYLNARFHILALIKAVQTDPPAETKTDIKAAVDEVKTEVKQNNAVLPY